MVQAYRTKRHLTLFLLLIMQSLFINRSVSGDKLLRIYLVCPINGTTLLTWVLEGFNRLGPHSRYGYILLGNEVRYRYLDVHCTTRRVKVLITLLLLECIRQQSDVTTATLSLF